MEGEFWREIVCFCAVWFVLGNLFAVLTLEVPYFLLSFIFFNLFFTFYFSCGEKVVGVLL